MTLVRLAVLFVSGTLLFSLLITGCGNINASLIDSDSANADGGGGVNDDGADADPSGNAPYRCANGIPTTGTPENGADVESCESCDAGYHLDGTLCAINTYTCANGTEHDDGTEGGAHQSEFCASCASGHHLDGALCAPNFALHSNGVTIVCDHAEVDETGIVNGIEYTKRENKGGDITISNAKTTCTSGITDMSGMFQGKRTFNEDIGSWDVASVKNMNSMFQAAESFNQDIGNWNVSNVIDMGQMFSDAWAFNQDIGDWNTGSVTNMSFMLRARSFDQDISGWDVRNVTDMSGMFNAAYVFNQDIGTWKVGSVTNMSNMFAVASKFNKNIGDWNTASVTNMKQMFYNASDFGQDLSKWCVSQVESDKRSDFEFGTSASLTTPQWGSIASACPPRVESARLENTLTSATATIALDGSSENIAVNENTVIVVKFQEDVNPKSGEIIILRDGVRNPIPVTDGNQVDVTSGDGKVIIDLTDNLAPGTSYTVTLPAGIFLDADTPEDVNDAVTFSFTTAGG